MSSTHKTTLEIPVTVHYEARPFIKGSFESGGLQIEPDEPAHIEIDSVTVDPDWRPSAAELDDLREHIALDEADADDFAREEQADRMRDARLEMEDQ